MAVMAPETPLFYTLRTVARILGVNEKTVRSYHKNGRLAAFTLGNRLQFEENNLLDFMGVHRTPKMNDIERESLRSEMREIRESMTYGDD